MKILKEQDYTINICTDIIEWAKEFYGMPDGAELANEEENCICNYAFSLCVSECMGFAQIDEKSVWVFVPKEYDLKDLKETIAHEIGHIVEMEYPTNPEQIEAAIIPPLLLAPNDELQEMKADHYMNFYLLVDKIVTDVIGALAGN